MPNSTKKKWQIALINSYKDNSSLIEELQLKQDTINKKDIEIISNKKFPTLAPKSFVKNIQKNNINDPLLKQILPISLENNPQPPEYIQDPLNEKKYSPTPGLIHKYKSRVLIINSTQCAINCRYCFRRNFPYSDHKISKENWIKICKYISTKPEINEVVFSGGDPLLMSDEQLKSRMDDIARIPNIKTIRFHTRIPIVLPERIDADFLKLLDCFYKEHSNKLINIIMVIHCNHPNELSNEIKEVILKLKKINIIIYNQAVLLKGVNDSPEVQIALWEKGYNMGILPYYLHLLDPVAGAAHFEVSKDVAKSILKEVQAELPGYMVPKLAQEIPGMKSKQTL
jgi:L-lysine 2,3-aminomutase